MSDYRQQVQDLIEQAKGLGITQVALQLLEEAIRAADFHRDEELGFNVRLHYIILAAKLMQGERAAVAFSWVLAAYDRDPQRYAFWSPLGAYRLVVGRLCNLPNVSRNQIEQLMADLARRTALSGESTHWVVLMKRNIAQDFGDRAMAAEANKQLKGVTPTVGKGYVRWLDVLYSLFMQDDARAIRTATPCLKPILTGRSTDICDTRVVSQILIPLAAAGRLPEALTLQTRTSSSLHPQDRFSWEHGKHLRFLALAGKLNEAVRLYERYQHAILQGPDPMTQLHFYLDSLPLFDQLQAANQTELAVQLPAAVDVPHVSYRYPIARLREWIHNRASDLAGRFDRRNGTSYYQEELERSRTMRPFVAGSGEA